MTFRRWLSSRWFAPNALKKFAAAESIGGIYIPYWTYDCYTTSYYTGERGEHYWETETYTDTDSNGNAVTKTRQVMKVRWYGASGTVERGFDDILVAATKSVQSRYLHRLGPWDLSVLKPYDSAYLTGFSAQRYQVDIEEGFESAKSYMDEPIRCDVENDIGGDEQRIHSVRTHYSAITFKSILLPVHLGSYAFNNSTYQVLVNGLDGQIHGDRPYSVWKISLVVLAVLLVTGLLLLYISLQNN